MPSSSRRTRERHLAKLYERRRNERLRRRRRRIVAGAVGAAVALAGVGSGLFLLTRTGTKAKPRASASSSATPAQVACGGSVPAAASQKKPTFAKAPKMTIDPKKTYTATVATSCGTIVIKLDPKLAPKTVNSFVFLARKHFFDGLIFHRIVRDFVIQGGDPTGTGTSGPGYKTVDAPPKDATYPVGTVAMAKAGNEPAGTAGSQFFIVTGSGGSGLTPDYAIIGKVTTGQDVADKIGMLPIENGATDGKPVPTVYIVKITIGVS